MSRSFAFAVLAALPAATGCSQPCSGEACDEERVRAWLSLYRGSDLLADSAASDTLEITGLSLTSQRWQMAIDTERVILGDPGESLVQVFDASGEGEVETDEANLELQGELGDELGSALATVPDTTGNGFSDLLIGAPGEAASKTSRTDGGVYLFEGPELLDEQTTLDSSYLHLQGTDPGGRMGSAVAGCADMDGDGLGEWAASAPQDNSGEILAGSVVLVLSSEALEGEVLDTELAHRWTGSIRGELAGSSLSCVHDLTGDGVPDLAVAAPFSDGDEDAAGRIYVLSGQELPPSGTLEEASTRTLQGISRDAWTGWSLATGDVDGDGHADIAAGAPGMEDARGWVLLWDGADVAQRGDLYPDYRVRGIDTGDRFGHRVSLMDLDGDGLAELGVGAPRQIDPDDALGGLYLFSGAEDYVGWRPFMEADRATSSWLPTHAGSQSTLEMIAGDVDGDGAAELLLLQLELEE